MYTDGSINKDLSGWGSTVSRVLPPPTKIVLPIGQFSQAGLHEWMPFIIFHARSRKRLQLPLPGWFLSRHWFTLCVTMEVEPRIAMLLLLLLLLQLLLLLHLQVLEGKCDRGCKKVSWHNFFSWPGDCECVEKNAFFLQPIARATSSGCQTHSDYGPSKMPLKLAV